MARFCDLNIDVLYIIISYLQDDKTMWRDLALVCRMFRDIAQRRLVRDVTMCDRESSPRSELFLRTLTSRPDLIPYVHRLELHLRHGEIYRSGKREIIHDILRRLTNLRELCYPFDHDQAIYRQGTPRLQWTPEWPNNQMTRIFWYSEMSIDILRQCMALPVIKSIHCGISQTPSDRAVVPAKTSSLVELQVSVLSKLPLEDFWHTLCIPKCLQKLALKSTHHWDVGPPMELIMPVLQPVHETLQELHLAVNASIKARRTPSGDFSPFRSLRTLSIPLTYLLGSGRGDDVGKAGRLPRQLEELSLYFLANREATPRFRGETRTFQQFRDWAADMREHPSLRHVFLEEKDRGLASGVLPWNMLLDFVSSMECDGSTGFNFLLPTYKKE